MTPTRGYHAVTLVLFVAAMLALALLEGSHHV